MERIPTWAIAFSLLLLLIYSASANAVEDDVVRASLVSFLQKLSNNNSQLVLDLKWNASIDPCPNVWTGVDCKDTNSVHIINLEGQGLNGSIDASLVCKVESLKGLILQDNQLQGQLPPEISDCTELTHLYVGGNRLSGRLPSSLSQLSNLKRLNVSYNNFSGELPPDLPRISGLKTFVAQNNSLDGTIPQFDFTNLGEFDVSYNRLSGPVPRGADKLGLQSFVGNPGLCGDPVSVACPPAPQGKKKKSKSLYEKKVIMVSGYIALGIVVFLFLAYKLASRKKARGKKQDGYEKRVADGSKKSSIIGSKTTASRSEYSLPTSNESAATTTSSSLVVLMNPLGKELKFEELLKAPAELLGRGRFGSLYKVIFDDGTALTVKRIKDWAISAQDFRKRMERIDRVKHPNVLSAVAFYCSKQEKLVVFEHQKNGSLFKLLRGSQNAKPFDWDSRLGVAGGIADGLAFMHQELRRDGLGHGNLKSTNILIKTNMEPCISEYGLMATTDNNQNPPSSPSDGTIPVSIFKADIYNFGIILLELLTGKLVQNNGSELAKWVNSVVREEWTVEVFDKALLSEGAFEDQMVRLLQVALKCTDPSPDARPSMNQVAAMIDAITEEDDRSTGSEGSMMLKD